MRPQPPSVHLGGLYYTLNAVLGPVIPIRTCHRAAASGHYQCLCGFAVRSVRLRSWLCSGSVALSTAFYEGEAKLEASTLYIVVGALAAVSFGILLLLMKRKCARTGPYYRPRPAASSFGTTS
jgi:hypothetical protein